MLERLVHEFLAFVVWASIESGSCHYRLLFDRARSSSRQITFSSPLSVFSCLILLYFVPPLYHPPRIASMSLFRSLCQQLKDFFDKSSAHTSNPSSRCPVCPRHSFQGNRLVIPLRRAKQSSKHEGLSPRWNSGGSLAQATTFTFTAFRTWLFWRNRFREVRGPLADTWTHHVRRPLGQGTFAITRMPSVRTRGRSGGEGGHCLVRERGRRKCPCQR